MRISVVYWRDMFVRCAVIGLALAWTGAARAEPSPGAPLTVAGEPGRRVTVDAPAVAHRG